MEIDAEKGRKKLDEIENALAAASWENDYGIYGGTCGYLVFLNELARFKNAGEKYEPQMSSLCEAIFSRVQQGNINTSFGNGLAGLVFTLHYLGLDELIDSQIFECIETSAVENSGRENYDFIYGSTGMVYALSEAGYENRAFYDGWLSRIESRLAAFPEGYRLPVNYKGHPFSQDDFQYNYSLSHGLLAMLVTITGLLEKKQADKKHEAVAEKLISSILAMRNTDLSGGQSMYPTIIRMDDSRQYFKRISWCYGDLGVAIMLNRYMKYKGTSVYRDQIIEILDHYLQYTRPETMDVKDADFCHGAAGTAITYLFFHQEFGDIKYREMAVTWFNIMLSMDTFPDGAAGYKHFDPDGFFNSYDLLEGISGIGLTLITFLSGQRLNWQSCFLIH